MSREERLLILLGVAGIISVDIATLSFPNTREFNDNNPFGVTQGPSSANFLGVVGYDAPLLIFSNVIFGIIAAFSLLQANYFQNGRLTVSQIGTAWSGDTSGNYAQALSELTGYEPNQVLNYWTDGITLMNGIAKLENGAGTIIPTTYLTIGLIFGGLTA